MNRVRYICYILLTDTEKPIGVEFAINRERAKPVSKLYVNIL